MKCGKCGHSRTWHLNSAECMYTGSRCDCKSFGSVVGLYLTALVFFTCVGLLTIITGIISLIRSSVNGVYDGGQIFIGCVSFGLGFFMLTYMNIRTQRLARKSVLESNL